MIIYVIKILTIITVTFPWYNYMYIWFTHISLYLWLILKIWPGAVTYILMHVSRNGEGKVEYAQVPSGERETKTSSVKAKREANQILPEQPFVSSKMYFRETSCNQTSRNRLPTWTSCSFCILCPQSLRTQTNVV